MYVALLRTYHNEFKDLVTMALDTLMPALPRRLRQEDFVKAMKWTKKVVFEEGHSLPQLIHVWNIIVRHSSLFYPFRAHFVPQMVSSLSRLGLPPNCPVDHRQVAVGCAEVLIGWEYIRLERLELKNSIAVDLTTATANQQSEKEDEFSLHASMVQMLTNFLVRLGLFVADSREQALRKLSDKCINLYRTLVTIVPMKCITVTYFERQLRTFLDNYNGNNGPAKSGGKSGATSKSSIDTSIGRMGCTGSGGGETSENIFITFVEFLSASLESNNFTSSLLYHNVLLFKELLAPLFVSELMLRPNVNSLFRALLCKIFKCFPPTDPAPLFVECGFYQHLTNLMDKALRVDNVETALASLSRKGDSPRDGRTAGTATKATSPLYACGWVLQLLDDICAVHASWVENHGSGVALLCRQLMTVHLSQAAKGAGDGKGCAPSTGSGGTAPAGKIGCIYPTPHIAMAVESMTWSPLLTDSGSTSSAASASSEELISSLVQCLSILCSAIDKDLLAEHRNFTLSALHGVLQVSDSHVLLSLAVRYCCKWIAVKDSPLSAIDQASLYANIVPFDRWSVEMNAQSSIYRIVALTERVNILHQESGGKGPTWAERFLSLLPNSESNALNTYGFICTHPHLQRLCTNRMVSYFNANNMSMYNRVLAIAGMNWHHLENRYWLGVLPSLLLANVMGGKDAAVMDMLNKDYCPTSIDTNAAQACTKLLVPPNHPLHFLLQKGSRSTEGGMTRNICYLALLLPDVADAVWQACTEYVWATTTTDEQRKLSLELVGNVARHDYRTRLLWPPQLYGRLMTPSLPRNVPKSLVSHVISVNLKSLPVDFLGAVGCGYGFWHCVSDEIISLIECGDLSATEVEKALRVVVNTLQDVGDSESILQIYRQWSKHPSTRQMLALQEYDLQAEAQTALFRSISGAVQWQDKTRCGGNDLRTGTVPDAAANSPLELQIWEERWLESARKMSQWDIVTEYGESAGMIDVCVEAAAMLKDWNRLKRLKASNDFEAQCDRGNYNFKLLEGLVAVVDQKYPQAERSYSQSVQMALCRWSTLPALVGGSNGTLHKDLLHFFHRAVELRESIGIMVDVTSMAAKKSLPDLKGNLVVWRERLPDACDSLVRWDGVLRWRTHVFSLIQNLYRNVTDESQLAALHDFPWTVVTLARAARQHRLEDLTMETLTYLNSVSTMDVQDVYAKLREQILVYLTNSENQLYTGISIINSTNLEYFDATQKAELFRLKALFQMRIGLHKEPQQTFSQCVQMCPLFGKGWVSWGDFCYNNFMRSRLLEDAQSSIVCVIKAIESNYPVGQVLLSRALWLVACADDSSHLLANTLKTRTTKLPTWMWLPYLPTLMGALRRPESSYAADILCDVGFAYPEAVLHFVHQQVGSCHDAPVLSPEEMACHSRIYEAIVTKHPMLVKSVTQLQDALGSMFAPHVVFWQLSHLLDSIFVSIVDDYYLRWDELIPDRLCELLTEFFMSRRPQVDSDDKLFNDIESEYLQYVDKKGQKCTVLEVGWINHLALFLLGKLYMPVFSFWNGQ